MIKRTGLTEEQSANSFSDEDLVGMVCGNNPQANAYRELLASRQSLLDCKQRIQQLLAERNSTGLAIDKAILSGIVPERHPLRSRLKLLANHHKREQALAELLRRARRYVSPLSCPESEIQIVQSIVSSIDSVLAGQLPDPAVTVTETIRTAPERIWLQVGDQSHYHSEPFPSDTSEVSWCADSVIACEVPYVRADLLTLRGHPEQFLEMVKKMKK
ncbi:hypothetical protein [Aeromonas caviae]|uniref:hypothetical protein n=1 Tax=Aeromonas caviae TaxID=648 RepID=UPI001B608077|nr:hypothetical protein [Aeromonas caviae]MBP8222679.1 hypothetical protein [Aeromonas sp.]GJA87807.1 hypothetical protein KAM356_38660 [Aeromonas caviae]GJA89101.1 hypothetical protein KAM357_10490 [Aeromonas caviae]GJB06438.1 hypothetical protein KAM361_11110 [Aeromonas caviae]GJB15160.1 hypothetical protein KAM363_11650 [Aeromonas caviae]